MHFRPKSAMPHIVCYNFKTIPLKKFVVFSPLKTLRFSLKDFYLCFLKVTPKMAVT